MNRIIACLRARVEHPFRVLKCQFGYRKTRYRGLKRLLADIEDGLVDVAVIYKIDRLSRSLMDVSKPVEVFGLGGLAREMLAGDMGAAA